MKVQFSFKHVDQSDALMTYTMDRIEKLTRFELKPMDVHFTVSMESRHECKIDVHVLEGRRKFKAEAISDDFYRSVEMVINKLGRQLAKNKARVKNRGHADIAMFKSISRVDKEREMLGLAEPELAETDTMEPSLRKAG